MEVSIARDDLIRIVGRAASVADRKSPMPILGLALLTVGEDEVSVAATNLYTSVRSTSPAVVVSQGACALPPKEVLERLNVMPDGPITLSMADKVLTIKGEGSRKFTVSVMSSTDYPDLPQRKDHDAIINVPPSLLARLPKKVGFAVSTDESRPHLSGAQLVFSTGQLTAIGTDGHRLSIYRTVLPGCTLDKTVLLPVRGLTLLANLGESLRKEGVDVLEVSISGEHVFASTDELAVSVKLTEAQFPPWQQVVPKTTEQTVTFNRKELTDVVKAVMVASGTSKAIRFTFSTGGVQVSSESPDVGTGEDMLACSYEGKEKVVGMCAKYVLETLASSESDEVVFGVNGELDPTTFSTESYADPGQGGTFGVVMPMRI